MQRREIAEDSNFSDRFDKLDPSRRVLVESALNDLSMGSKRGKPLSNKLRGRFSLQKEKMRIVYSEEGQVLNMHDLGMRGEIDYG